jgi:hypothetical protein
MIRFEGRSETETRVLFTNRPTYLTGGDFSVILHEHRPLIILQIEGKCKNDDIIW